MDNTEIGKIINHQKKIFNDLDKQHQLLLDCNTKNSEYDDIKRQLKWDDTDKVIRAEYNKVLELKEISKKNIDISILDEESLWNYCIENNYVVTNIRNYKGIITDELLEQIHLYSKNNDCRLDSEANLDRLFILCRLKDVDGENNNKIKKSKRYKQSELPKIMLLERELKGNAYKNEHYKVIFEIGKQTPITNKINSIFFTHVKTRNLFNYFLLFGGILLALSLLIFAINVSYYNTDAAKQFVSNNMILKLTYIILFIFTIPWIFSSYSRYNDVNTYYHDNYGDWEIVTKFSSNYLPQYFLKLKNHYGLFKIKIRVFISFLIMFLTIFLVGFFINRLDLIRVIEKNGGVMVYNYNCSDNENIIHSEIYKKDGILSYSYKKLDLKKEQFKEIDQSNVFQRVYQREVQRMKKNMK